MIWTTWYQIILLDHFPEVDGKTKPNIASEGSSECLILPNWGITPIFWVNFNVWCALLYLASTLIFFFPWLLGLWFRNVEYLFLPTNVSVTCQGV